MAGLKQAGAMLKNINTIKKNMDTIQKQLSDSVYAGESAQGLVKINLKGSGEMVSLTIDPEAMTEDSETVAALVQVAYNKALEAKDKDAKDKLGSITAGLGALGLGGLGL